MEYTIEFKQVSKVSDFCTETAIVVKKGTRLYCFHFKFVHDGDVPSMTEGHAHDGKYIVVYKQNRSLEELIEHYFNYSEVPNAGEIPTKWEYLRHN